MNVHAPPGQFRSPDGEDLPRSEAPAVPEDTRLRQAQASDPAVSAWVSANAGAGKTHVLSERVVRLLLEGVDPLRILCLTYTKAAAAQMTTRVHSRLAEWTRLGEAQLAATLAPLCGEREPPRQLVERARRLFADALETPGGLKIQTIHAFCEAVLHRFPLEANVSGRFRMVDDAERAVLMEELRSAMLARSQLSGHAEEGAVEAILRLGQEDALDNLLKAIDARRAGIDRTFGALGGAGGTLEALRERMGVPAEATVQGILDDGWPLPGFGPERMQAVIDSAANHPGTTNDRLRARLKIALDAQDESRIHELHAVTHSGQGTSSAPFKTRIKIKKDGERSLTSCFTKDVQNDLPWLIDAIEEAEHWSGRARDRLQTLALADATHHALHLAERLRDDWRTMKHARGLLDFDDLIARTADLLERDGASAWVHYKLDRGIDHILVDEAQDTSPDQWRVITKLAEEFFAGESERPRTLFAVGDPKQSIYSFQGAEPEGFDRQRRMFGRAAGEGFRDVSLKLSFRSTPDVLAAVDRVFAEDPANRGVATRSVGKDGDTLVEPPEHTAIRHDHAGRVDIWPVIERSEETERSEDWTAPIDRTGEGDPRIRLARRVAGTIRDWIDMGETLPARHDPVRPGDILILVRKRDAFVNAVTRELSNLGVPVAGEDRLAMTHHIAVEDLTAIGRAVLNPHDDLSLAAAAKSPLIGLTEDDLFALAHGRDEAHSLWRTLRRRGGENPAWAAASERIHAWRQRVDTEPPYEFFARILGEDGGRGLFVRHLGPQVHDVLDEFLARAIAERDAALPGLESFLASLAGESPVVKRESESGADEVRVMTVHGAKGLEAPIVFLVDSGGDAVHASHLPILMELDGEAEAPGPIAWAAPGLSRPEPLDAARREAEEKAAEEYRRLLYVGMTRAEDRLIVCGYRTAKPKGEKAKGEKEKEPEKRTWHEMCEAALVAPGLCDALEPDAQGEPSIHRFELGGTRGGKRAPKAREQRAARSGRAFRHLAKRAAPVAEPPRPLSPCGATALIEGEPVHATSRAAPLSPVGTGGADAAMNARAAMKRGTLVHRLLQVLPGLPADERRAAAERYVSRAASDLDEERRIDVLRTALRVIDKPALASLFEGEARTEVPIMGMLDVAGTSKAVSGVIDRMIVRADRVLLVDYKTGANPPHDERGVPPVHVAQMALYRALAQPLFPGREVCCALVYTRSAARFDLGAARMDAMLERVLERGGIDAESGGLAPDVPEAPLG